MRAFERHTFFAASVAILDCLSCSSNQPYAIIAACLVFDHDHNRGYCKVSFLSLPKSFITIKFDLTRSAKEPKRNIIDIWLVACINYCDKWQLRSASLIKIELYNQWHLSTVCVFIRICVWSMEHQQTQHHCYFPSSILQSRCE